MKASINVDLEVEVSYANGNVRQYRTSPLDVWRAEKLTGQSITDAVNTFTGLAALAYSCALRAGDAYKARKKDTGPLDLFEDWLAGVADMSVIGDDELEEDTDSEDPPAGDDVDEDQPQAPSPITSPPSPTAPDGPPISSPA